MQLKMKVVVGWLTDTLSNIQRVMPVKRGARKRTKTIDNLLSRYGEPTG
jgi:hypothetical protein